MYRHKSYYMNRLSLSNYQHLSKMLLQFSDSVVLNKLLEIACIDPDVERANNVIFTIFQQGIVHAKIDWKFLTKIVIDDRNFYLIRRRIFEYFQNLCDYCEQCEYLDLLHRENSMDLGFFTQKHGDLYSNHDITRNVGKENCNLSSSSSQFNTENENNDKDCAVHLNNEIRFYRRMMHISQMPCKLYSHVNLLESTPIYMYINNYLLYIYVTNDYVFDFEPKMLKIEDLRMFFLFVVIIEKNKNTNILNWLLKNRSTERRDLLILLYISNNCCEYEQMTSNHVSLNYLTNEDKPMKKTNALYDDARIQKILMQRFSRSQIMHYELSETNLIFYLNDCSCAYHCIKNSVVVDPKKNNGSKMTKNINKCRFCDRLIPSFQFMRTNCKNCDLKYLRTHGKKLKFLKIQNFGTIKIMENDEIKIVEAIKKYMKSMTKTASTPLNQNHSCIFEKQPITDVGNSSLNHVGSCPDLNKTFVFIYNMARSVIHHSKFSEKSLEYIILFALATKKYLFLATEAVKIKNTVCYRSGIINAVRCIEDDQTKMLALYYIMCNDNVFDDLFCFGYAIYKYNGWTADDYEELATNVDKEWRYAAITPRTSVDIFRKKVKHLFDVPEYNNMLQHIHKVALIEKNRSLEDYDMEDLVIYMMRNTDKDLKMNNPGVLTIVKSNIIPVLYTLKRYGGTLHDLLYIFSFFDSLECVFYEIYVFVEYFLMKEHQRVVKEKIGSCRVDKSERENMKSYVSELLYSFYGRKVEVIEKFICFYLSSLKDSASTFLFQISVFLPDDELQQYGHSIVNQLLMVKGEYTEMLAAYRMSRLSVTYDRRAIQLLYKYNYFETIGNNGFLGTSLISSRFNLKFLTKNESISDELFENTCENENDNNNHQYYFPEYYNFQNKIQFIKSMLENLLIKINEPIEIYFYAIQTLIRKIDISIIEKTKRLFFSTYHNTKYELKDNSYPKSDDLFERIVAYTDDEIVKVGMLFNVKEIKDYVSLYCVKYYKEIVMDHSIDDDLILLCYFYGDYPLWKQALDVAIRKEMWYGVEKIIEDVFDKEGIFLGTSLVDASDTNLSSDHMLNSSCNYQKDKYTTEHLINILQYSYYKLNDYVSFYVMSMYKFDETTLSLLFKMQGYDDDQNDELVNVDDLEDEIANWNMDCEIYNNGKSSMQCGKNKNKLNRLMHMHITEEIDDDNLTKLHFIDDFYKMKNNEFDRIVSKRRLMKEKGKILKLHKKMIMKDKRLNLVFEDKLKIDEIEWLIEKQWTHKGKKKTIEMMMLGDWRGLFYYGKICNNLFYCNKAVDKLSKYHGIGYKVDDTKTKCGKNINNNCSDDDAANECISDNDNTIYYDMNMYSDENLPEKKFRQLKQTSYYKQSCKHYYREAVMYRTITKNTLESFDDALKRLGKCEKILFLKAKLMETIDVKVSYDLYLESMRYGNCYFEESFPRALHILTENNLYGHENKSSEYHVCRYTDDKQDEQQHSLSEIHQYVGVDNIMAFYLQIISKISHQNNKIVDIIVELLSILVKHNPWLCIWQTLSLLNSGKTDVKNRLSCMLNDVSDIVWILKEYTAVLGRIGSDKRTTIKISNYGEIKQFLIPIPVSRNLNCLEETVNDRAISKNEVEENVHGHVATEKNGEIQTINNILKKRTHYEDISKTYENKHGLQLVIIASYNEHITVFKSLQSPKRIIFVDEAGRQRSFLVKANDDLRKDQRMIELFDLLIKYNLSIRKYVVVPITTKLGIIEWIDGLISLKSICITGKNKEIALSVFKKYKKKLGKDFFKYNNKTESVLKTWYNTTYRDPVKWHIAKRNYVKTLATMSGLGYFLGLGDRHCENILIDIRTGDVVHVDLNLLFDRGKKLSVPERVPFRLTKNIRECLGILRENGQFRYYLENTINIIIKFRNIIEAHLLAFVYDPIAEIKKPSETIKKLFSRMEANGLVNSLISESTDENNLSEMYIGWLPFI